MEPKCSKGNQKENINRKGGTDNLGFACGFVNGNNLANVCFAAETPKRAHKTRTACPCAGTCMKAYPGCYVMLVTVIPLKSMNLSILSIDFSESNLSITKTAILIMSTGK